MVVAYMNERQDGIERTGYSDDNFFNLTWLLSGDYRVITG